MENYNLSKSVMFDVSRIYILSNTSNNEDLRSTRYDTFKSPIPSIFKFKYFFSKTTYDEPLVLYILISGFTKNKFPSKFLEKKNLM